MRQMFEHPSLFSVLLSSQISDPTITPSPQYGWQVSKEELLPPEQIQVERTDKQSEAHPSLSFQTPSSQISGGDLLLFPQTSQILGLVDVSQLEFSSLTQDEEQPSPESVLLSSHPSLYAFLPSPQEEIQIFGEEVEQLNPNSIVHVDEQPSFGLMFPSSQSSFGASKEFPQVEVHTEGVPEH